MTHSDLVRAGYEWLLSIGCSFALPELTTYAAERPDVIGWKNSFSILIECKTSLSDFRADQKKRFRLREELGVGYYRFYLSPESLITPEILPEKWGLLWMTEKGKIERVVAPKGNIWTNWPCFPERNLFSEIQIMASALRRVNQNKDLEKIFTKDWR